MLSKKIKVEWELDGIPLETAGVSDTVEVPMSHYLRGGTSVSEYLSDKYGWLVLDWWDAEDKDEESEQ